MLEVEIQKLTAAIQALTGTTEALVTATMQMRSSLHLIAGDIKEMTAEKSYREDDTARVEMQRKRDEAAANPVEVKAPKKSSPKKAPAPEQEPEKVEAPSRDITADDLKTVAMELVRVDSSARDSIVQILADHNSKTIPHLDPKHYNSVHGALLKLAKSIYDKSEEV